MFVITAPPDYSKEHKDFMALVLKYRVEKYILIIGPIEKDCLSELYKKIDFVFLLSKLESFSNNIIESWYFKKLLIVSDELWAKSICKDTCFYVNRDDSASIADAIIHLIENPLKVKNFVNLGNQILKSYPSIKKRINQELEYIKAIQNKS